MRWAYDPIAGRVDTGSEGRVTVYRHSVGFLIAAAPELLAALEAVVCGEAGIADIKANPTSYSECWDLAVAAIAKAKGEPHDR